MTDPFLGEIRMFAGDFAPIGWALCDGSLVPINQSSRLLFSLLGARYGGDGVNNFALPDLRGRFPLQQGQGPGLSPRDLGEHGGSPTVTLSIDQLPAHTHAARASSDTSVVPDPEGKVWGTTQTGRNRVPTYAPAAAPTVAMAPTAIGPTGGGGPHDNMPPYLVGSYIICLNGILPPRP